ncbi:hypothetical protein V1264_024632 [Littorina saxatilis]|uniref:Uncharacterized protein n=1 Tax=Littorina saxatilis TaxID=31220 RepID=A0AAN9AM10_9CAEN
MNVKVTGVVFCLLLLVAVSLSSEHDDTLIDLEEERFERSPFESDEAPQPIQKKKRAYAGRWRNGRQTGPVRL